MRKAQLECGKAQLESQMKMLRLISDDHIASDALASAPSWTT
jgi:hypothetical protein